MNKFICQLILFSSLLIGQQTTSAIQTTVNPLIDGNVIDDLAWADVPYSKNT